MTEQKKSFDDLDAVKVLVGALEKFNDEERDRIIRWACERLGTIYTSTESKSREIEEKITSQQISGGEKKAEGARNIKTFIENKDPKNDTHFTAVVAYYYRFEAPENERKESITSQDLNEAARLAQKPRFKKPAKTLHNAYRQAGLLDQVAHGKYKINTVGENLVAMVLPSNEVRSTVSRKTKTRKIKNNKKTKRK